MAEREEYRPPGKGGGNKKSVGPYTLARAIMDDHAFLEDRIGQLYTWNGMWWEPMTPNTLRAMILRYDEPGASRAEKRREASDTIRALSHKADLAWGSVGDTEVACRNGVIDVTTGRVRDHRAEDYLENVVQVDHEPGVSSTFWSDAMLTWFGEDYALHDALQEFFGYVVLPHARFKRALALKGPPDCGKSQIVHALYGLVGSAFACTLPVEHMDDPKLRSVIKGKRLNVISEVTSKALIADGGFKTMVSTEEPVLLDAKFKDPELYVSRAKHVIATNKLPRINDKTSATIRRLLILPMDRVIPIEEQITDFKDRILRDELPGILNWAIEGARRLLANGGVFTEPSVTTEMLTEYAAEANPFLGFAKEVLVADERNLALSQILPRFNAWNGSRMTIRDLGQLVRDAGYRVDTLRIVDVSAGQTSTAKGIKGYRMANDENDYAGPRNWLSDDDQPPPEAR